VVQGGGEHDLLGAVLNNDFPAVVVTGFENEAAFEGVHVVCINLRVNL
jgi:hypothetical protein